MLDHAVLSDALGYLSILCWLGAQFPQVIVNIRTKSVEGLALPFLANWLFGDITNLVGCILTHQLPFQTYLASYFVFVDMSLVAQYIYYYKPSIPSSPSHSTSSSRRSSLAMTLTPTAVVYSPRNLTRPSSRTPLLVGELEAGYRTYDARARSQTDGSSRYSGVLSSYPPAGLLPSAEEVSGKGKGRRQGSRASVGSRPSVGSLKQRVEKPATITTTGWKDDEGEGELAAMTESFYSDISAASAAGGAGNGNDGAGTSVRRHISWSRVVAKTPSPIDDTPGENTPRQRIVPQPSLTRNHHSMPDTSTDVSVGATPGLSGDSTALEQHLISEDLRKRSRSRGRASRRTRPSPLLVYDPASPGPGTGSGSGLDYSEGGLSAQQLMVMSASERERERESKSGSRRRRSASIVFLSVGFGALLTFGGSGGLGKSPAFRESSVSQGRVINLDTAGDSAAHSSWEPVPISQDFSPLYSDSFITPASPPSLSRTSIGSTDSATSIESTLSITSLMTSIESLITSQRRRRRERRPHEPPPLTPEQKRRLIGRISAWACTTLYLTSRLPQIWKNYTRKSVQGLSLALFVFAFLGNTFYVASILSSPVLWEYPPGGQPISISATAQSVIVSTVTLGGGAEPPYNSPRARAFLRESLPYLLGSGGTLLFDVVIVSQGIVYGRRERRLVEEEASESEDESGSDADGESSNGDANKFPRPTRGVGAGGTGDAGLT